MSANTTQPQESDDSIDIDDRDARALTEYMTVLTKGGDIYTVVGQNENGEYRVDNRKGRCTCPDHKHRNARCKHIRRVRMATGEKSIPSEVDGVDPQLGEHVDEGPEVVAADGGIIEATDDGEIIDDDENDDRPDDCQCLAEYIDDDPLACWACYREGFDSPNPNVDEEEEETAPLGDIEKVPAAWRNDDEDSGRPEPSRSEPADFGGGETTGVQDL